MLFKKKKSISSLEEFGNVIDSATEPAIKNAFQDIAMKLSLIKTEGNCKKIAITSSEYGEGKTYVAANLAIMLAQTFIDEKVLFVNVDFDGSSEISTVQKLVLSEDAGVCLDDYLSGKNDNLEFFRTDLKNLQICNCNNSALSPMGMLNSKKMNDLIDKFCDEYNYVIFNAAPVIPCSYSTAISGKADGYIIVAREGVTSIDSISNTEDAICATGGKIFGVVLTGHNKKQ